jgi:hypothetical protein
MANSNTDINLIKKANSKTSYSAHQKREIFKCMNDPLYFMETYMWIQHPDPAKGRMRFTAFEFQKRLINAYWQNISVIAMLPRQAGKCCINSTIITIRQPSTGDIYDLPIGTYYEWAACMRDGTTPPDINQYKRENNGRQIL